MYRCVPHHTTFNRLSWWCEFTDCALVISKIKNDEINLILPVSSLTAIRLFIQVGCWKPVEKEYHIYMYHCMGKFSIRSGLLEYSKCRVSVNVACTARGLWGSSRGAREGDESGIYGSRWRCANYNCQITNQVQFRLTKRSMITQCATLKRTNVITVSLKRNKIIRYILNPGLSDSSASFLMHIVSMYKGN